MPHSDGSPHFISLEHKLKGERLMRELFWAVGTFDQARPRTVQGMAGILGFSDLGGCREYIRASVAHDEKFPAPHPLKLPAFVGTWGGEGMEQAAQWFYGDAVKTQVKLTLDLGDGIIIDGSSDIIYVEEGAVVDLKSKAELDTVRRDGPSQKEWIQISGYLVACIQKGILPDTATAHLIYWDRSGQDTKGHVATIDFDLAIFYLDIARKRLEDVAVAIEQGVVQSYLRDEPESWCFAVSCPYYNTCWEGYTPTNEIEDPALIEAIAGYAKARDDEKAIGKVKAAARASLKQPNGNGDVHHVEGMTPDWIVKWTLVENPSGSMTERLEVRPRPKPPENTPVRKTGKKEATPA